MKARLIGGVATVCAIVAASVPALANGRAMSGNACNPIYQGNNSSSASGGRLHLPTHLGAAWAECGYQDDTYLAHNSVQYIYADVLPVSGSTMYVAACVESGHTVGDYFCGATSMASGGQWVDLSVDPTAWRDYSFGSGYYPFLIVEGTADSQWDDEINGFTFWD